VYGERVQDVEADIRTTHLSEGEPLLLVVGSEKVPFDVYEEANWNVGVTNQPPSEVAGLAVFLDRLFEGPGTRAGLAKRRPARDPDGDGQARNRRIRSPIRTGITRTANRRAISRIVLSGSRPV